MDQTAFPATAGSTLLKYARYSFFLALALLPIFLVPLTWFPFLMGKVFVYTSLVSLSLLFLCLSFIRAKRVELLHARYLALAALLPLSYGLATVFSIAPNLSFLGNGVETDTLFSVFSLFVTFFLGLSLISRKEHVRSLFSFLGLSALVVLGFQIVQVLAGTGLLGAPSANLVGTWNDFATIALLAGVVSLVLLQSRRISGLRFGLVAVIFIVSLAFLFIVNLNVSWFVLLGVAVILAGASFFARSGPAPQVAPVQMLSVPTAPSQPSPPVFLRNAVLPVMVGVISLVFLVWGSTINPYLTAPLSIAEVEARPSLESTYEIAQAAHEGEWYRRIIGSGPNTFSLHWVANKPEGVNTSIFWNVDFGVGFGTVPTSFVTTGILGALVILGLILIFVIAGLRAWVRSRFRLDAYLVAAFFGAVALLSLACFFPLSRTVLIIAVTLAATFLACGMPRTPTTLMFSGIRGRILALGVVLIVAGAAISGTTYATKMFFAQMYLGSANVALAAGDLTEAEVQVMRSLRMHTYGMNSRFLVSLGIERLNQIAQITEGTEEERSARFQSALTTAINNAQVTVAKDPMSYTNWVMLAAVYEFLVPLQVQGASEAAIEFFEEASTRSPFDPSLRLRIARIHAYAGNYDAFRAEIDRSIALKPNYTEAALLLSQVEVDRNNLPGALEAAAAAVQTAPQNPGLWFSLGLLSYSSDKMQDAATAFVQALTLAPDYANAKYFLGLSYYNLGRTEEAIILFANLVDTNPENAEVALILSNLRVGKAPFEGAQPPVTPNPEDRPTAPIQE